MTYGQQRTYIPRKTNHLLHLVLTLVTCGLWAFVWAGVAIYNAFTKDVVRTETYGPPR